MVMDGGEFENLDLPHTTRNRNFNLIAYLLANQPAADGRRCGDQALGNISLFTGYKPVVELDIFLLVEQNHAGT
jgi:hypothetical protein